MNARDTPPHTPLSRREFAARCAAFAFGGAAQAACTDEAAATYAAVSADLRRVGESKTVPERTLLAELIRYSTLAANSHNTQPWRFRAGHRSITLRPDFSRRCPAVDPDDHHLYVSLGCAAENLVIAAAAHGYTADVMIDEAGDGAVSIALRPAPPVDSPLFRAIPNRQSTRAVYTGEAAPAEHLALLAGAAQERDVRVQLHTDQREIERLAELIVAANTVQMRDAAFMQELRHWIRFNETSAVASRDGLFSAASGNPSVPEWMGTLLFRFAFTEGAENDKYANQMRSSAGVISFVAESESRANWVRIGRSSQRFALQATALGMKCAFVNQPVEVPAFRAPLASLIGVGSRRPDLLMRFGYGAALPASLRRGVDRVLD